MRLLEGAPGAKGIDMRAFQYRWKIGGREITGKKKAADRAALEAHIKGLGGELLEVLSETDAPAPPSQAGSSLPAAGPAAFPPAPWTAPPQAPAASPAIVEPVERPKTSLLHRSRSEGRPNWLIQVFAWLAIIMGALVLAAAILMIIVSLVSGFEWLGENISTHTKIILLGFFLGLGIVELAIGICMLLFPLFGAWFLLITNIIHLLFNFVDVFRGHFAAAVSGLISAFIIYHILRRR